MPPVRPILKKSSKIRKIRKIRTLCCAWMLLPVRS
jgi:hypothetical protein